jgi:parallel beta-helix repeat protein
MRSSRLMIASALVIGMLGAMAAGASAQSGAPLTVAQDGSADYDTITAAIEAAVDGDMILIAPGEYVESLFVDRDITLSGDGPRDKVTLAPDRSTSPIYSMEMEDPGPVGIYVDGADVTIEHLTLDTPEFISIGLIGGTSTVRDVVTNNFIGVREDASAIIEDSDLARVGLAGPNETIIRNNTVRDFIFASRGSTGTAEGNLVIDYPVVVNSGAHLDIIGNTFQPLDDEPGIVIEEPGTTAHVTGNDIKGGWVGILTEFPEAATIEDNRIDGSGTGIVVLESASIVRDNTVSGAADVGIYVAGDGVLVEGNSVEGGRMGMHLEPDPGDFPDDRRFLEDRSRIEGNSVTGASHFGIVVENSRPSISGNTICAGREPLKIVGDADPEIGTNEICEVAEG